MTKRAAKKVTSTQTSTPRRRENTPTITKWWRTMDFHTLLSLHAAHVDPRRTEEQGVRFDRAKRAGVFHHRHEAFSRGKRS